MSKNAKKLSLNLIIILLCLFAIIAAVQDSIWRLQTKVPLDGSGIFTVCAMALLILILLYVSAVRIKTCIQMMKENK